jgi:hypothetical protein
MRREPHGLHNLHEYRSVLAECGDSQEDVHFWARFGLHRMVHRYYVGLKSALEFDASSLDADEQAQAMSYLAEIGEILATAELGRPAMDEGTSRVQDFAALDTLLSLTASEPSNVMYWARIGVIEGLRSWRFMSEQVLSGKLEAIVLEGLAYAPETFLSHVESLALKHGLG